MGLRHESDRAEVYDHGCAKSRRADALGDLIWMIGLPKGPGQPYDPDTYVISRGREWSIIRDHARRFAQGKLV